MNRHVKNTIVSNSKEHGVDGRNIWLQMILISFQFTSRIPPSINPSSHEQKDPQAFPPFEGHRQRSRSTVVQNSQTTSSSE
jgi:hypothetical protein